MPFFLNDFTFIMNLLFKFPLLSIIVRINCGSFLGSEFQCLGIHSWVHKRDIESHKERESSDFPAGCALHGPLAITSPPSQWVARRHSMARGRKLRWCNWGPRVEQWDNDSSLVALSSSMLFFLIQSVTFVAQMWFDKLFCFNKYRND